MHDVRHSVQTPKRLQFYELGAADVEVMKFVGVQERSGSRDCFAKLFSQPLPVPYRSPAIPEH